MCQTDRVRIRGLIVSGLPILLYLLLVSDVEAATCYRQDTKNATDPIFTPCNTLQPFSMCYRSQVAADGFPADVGCLPNGVVQNFDPPSAYQYWRLSCTDPTWESPYCLNAFNACPADANGNAAINPCGNDAASTTWCCGRNNTACCGTSGAITIAAVLGPSSTSSSSSSTTQATPIASITSSSSTTEPTQATSSPISSTTLSPSTSAGLSGKDKAGIGIGVVVGVLAISALVGWIVLRRKKSRKTTRPVPQITEKTHDTVGELDASKSAEARHRLLHEVDGQRPPSRHHIAPVELDAYGKPHTTV